ARTGGRCGRSSPSSSCWRGRACSPRRRPRAAWPRQGPTLRRRARALPGACPLGRVAAAAASLLLCIMTGGECKQWWADAAHEMRQDALSVVEWTSTTWPVLHLLGHVAVAVAEEGGIRPATILTVTPTGPCCAGRLRTDVFGEGTNEGIRAIFGTTLSKPFDTSCPAGFQWVATVKMSLCARLEVKCARGTMGLRIDPELEAPRRRKVRRSRLRGWAAHAGEWRLPTHQA
ncbi:unnamed protein product, partial [Prorocentrum cordatum]